MRNSVLLAVVLLPFAAGAQAPADKLVETYRDFAGSEANARALVVGLREKSGIVLSPTVTIEPPTEKMGFGNVDIALALAQASLKEQDIASPTAQQLHAALLGGSVTRPDGLTATLPGVLEMRAGGMGWDEIAHALGFKLGELMRAERPDRPERPYRPDKPEKPQRPGR